MYHTISKERDMFVSARNALSRHFPTLISVVASTEPPSHGTPHTHLKLVGEIPDHWYSESSNKYRSTPSRVPVACYVVVTESCTQYSVEACCELIELCNFLNLDSFPTDLYVYATPAQKSDGTSIVP